MKKYSLLFIICTLSFFSKAQQLQESSFYDMQGVLFNPGMAGIQKAAFIGATYRTQWSSMNGSPKTATVFASMPLEKVKIGLAGNVFRDQTGPTSRTGLDLSFAKHIALGNGTLSLGIETRFQQYSIDVNKLSESLGSDPVLANGNSKFKFDAGFGIAYADDQWQLGASVSQLVQSKLDFYSGSLSRSAEAKLYRHYYAHGLYKWAMDENTVIQPHFMLIYLPNAPVEFQGGVRVEHNKLFWWGLSLRAEQSWLLSAGLHINEKATLGYSFELYRTPVSIYDKGANAHELLLRYDFLK